MDPLRHATETHAPPNGTSVLNVIVPNLPFSVVSVWLAGGSRFDPVGKAGLAHLLEHLVSHNGDYPDQESFYRALEERGIFNNAYTSKESVSYYHYQPTEESARSLDVLLRTLGSLELPPERLEKERSVVTNEAARNRQSADDFLWELSNEGLWGDTPLGRRFYGTDETLAAITAPDLETFYDRHYRQGRKHVVAINYPDFAELVEKTAAYLSQPVETKPSATIALAGPQDRQHDLGNAHTQIGLNARTAPFGHPHRRACDLLARILGGSWLSLGTTELRFNHSLTYWVDSFTENFSDQGLLRLSYSVPKEQVAASLAILQESIRSLQEKPLSSEDLQAHINSYTANQTRYFTNPYELLWHYGFQRLFSNEVTNLASEIEAYRTLTPADIQEAARLYLSEENQSIVTIS